jgi:DNA polymerase-1
MNKLFLIDAYAIIYRSYYAFINNPRVTSAGLNTSAIFGFLTTLQDVIAKEAPTHLAVCFDPKGGTFRHEAYPDYKAQREAQPEDITAAVPYVKRLIEAYRIPVIEVPGYEADDVVGTIARQAEERGDFDTYMLTPDKDYAQLVAAHTFMYRPKSFGPGYEVLGVPEVLAKYQLTDVRQVIDLLGLMGDTADNIPGCPGVGEKTAQKLLAQFGTVENMLEHTDQLKGAVQRRVVAGADLIRQSRFLAEICRTVPVEFDEELLRRREPDYQALLTLFEELEFRRTAEKLLAQWRAADPSAAASNAAIASAATSAAKQSGSAKTSRKAAKAAAADDGMGSLFDQPEEEVASETAVPEVVSSFSTLDDLTTDYRLCDTAEARADLMQQLFFSSRWGFKVQTEGTEAMTATLQGIAFALDHHRAYYVPMSEAALADLRTIFEQEGAEKVAHDVKFDYIVLRRHDITPSVPLFDPMIAHYLLQSEQRHDLATLAETRLHYRLQPAADDTLRCACEAADVALTLAEGLSTELHKRAQEQLFRDVEMPLAIVLADMELTGVRIDTAALTESREQLIKQAAEVEQQMYATAGHSFNPQSPKAVGEVLFDELKLDAKAKKTRTGQYVTSEEVLLKLRDKSPIIDQILTYRGIKKLLSTYVDALPALINPATGRIHASFNQTVAVTGRLSSSNPNLQNIPIRDEMGRELRKAFVPDDGCIFFSADYSQIELRLMAHLSEDPAMIEAFRHGGDIHTATAAKIYHVDPEQVTKQQRTKAKTANFGIIYGISIFGLSSRLNIPRAEAKELIDGYFATYPRVHAFMEESIERARRQGYVETLFGRRRMLPDIHSANATVRGYAERNAINAPIQGTAADIIKIAMVRIAARMKAEHLRARLLVQVHDELNFSVPADELDRLRTLVIEEMQGACALRVPLIADCGTGANWLEAH